jgi:hypothetical protein
MHSVVIPAKRSRRQQMRHHSMRQIALWLLARDMALAALTERVEAAGIETLALSPRSGDFNADLLTFGFGALRAALRIQLAPQDGCFIPDD